MKRHSVQTCEGSEKGAVVGYLRVSTDGQEDGNGLDVQRQHIVAYAAVQGIQIDQWFQDVESGAKEDRPGLAALREAVRAGKVGRVLVYRMDRLAREALLAEQLYRKLSPKARVVSVSESLGEGFTGDLMRRILAAFADYERAVIATRTKTGRRESVRKNGTFAGGHGVLGYRPEGQRGNPGKGTLRLIEQEAEAIRLIFAMRDQGTTLQKIAGELNAQGFRTKAGVEFSHVQVLRVLNREAFYRGQGVITRSVEGGALGAHSAIIT
jgi:DNA invertase Pin-like site-specific DNA recombinase